MGSMLTSTNKVYPTTGGNCSSPINIKKLKKKIPNYTTSP